MTCMYRRQYESTALQTASCVAGLIAGAALALALILKEAEARLDSGQAS